MRRIGFATLCALGLLSSNTYATTTYPLIPKLSIDYVFPPNEPQLFHNYLFWTVTATCSVESQQEQNLMSVEVVAKKVTVNDRVLQQGDMAQEVIRNGGKLNFTVEPGAKVQFTNLEGVPVTAKCATT